MLREIQEQPEVVRRLLAEGWPEVELAAEAIRARRVKHVQMAARGSSDNAARYGQYLFGALNGLVVGLATPSLYTVYGAPPRLEDTVVIGLSQSGQSPDVAGVVEWAREQGALTIAITNRVDSPIGRAAGHVIWIRAGDERSVPATKTYTAQLLALAMLGAAMSPSGSESGRLELDSLPGILSETLSLQPDIEAITGDLKSSDRAVVIGRGYNFSTAHEIALKLQETAYVMALPFSSADFQHGPLSIVEPGMPVIVFAPAGKVQAELFELAGNLHGWGARVILFGHAGDRPSPGTLPGVPIPALPEWLSPFPLAMAGQLFAATLARAKGLDPDRPRRLHKVTETF